MDYKTEQRKRQIALFSTAKKYGEFNGKVYEHILKSLEDNIFSKDVYEDVNMYFSANRINWHRCKLNMLSSQVACINHLFPIREDKDAVLSIAKQIDPAFSNVIRLDNDAEGTRGYISFEVVSDKDHLNETKSRKLTRGSNCTSIDAVIMAEKNGKKCLLVIEWKYTESYSNVDKSKDESGVTRLNSYTELTDESRYLKTLTSYNGSVYFHEPFYQLMRQTLWAEQMVKNVNEEVLKADSFIHVHVVPENNGKLLDRKYKCSDGQNLENTWNDCLIDKSIYRLISPQKLLGGLENHYSNLISYLRKRYW